MNMVTREQVIDLMNQLKHNKSNTSFKSYELSDMGLRLILIYLSKHPNTYAFTISKDLNISRERVRVLTVKLEEKKLITKTSSPNDARIELINLTKKGVKFIEEDKEQRIQFFAKIVEKIGYDKMMDFINTMNEIRDLISKDGLKE